MAKNKSAKLPKRIAGVKIPKAVRKGAIADFLGSKVGKALLAEAVMAAGALLAKQQSEPGSVTRKAARKSKEGLKDIAGSAGAAPAAVAAAPATLAYAFAEAGRAFAEAMRGRQPQGDAPAMAAPDDDWPADVSGMEAKAAKRAKPAVPQPH